MDHKIFKKGTVILFAVLLVTVVLTISLGVFNIVYRQILLSSVAKESTIAFAVADSARNCAQFWDSPERQPDSSRPFGFYDGTNYEPNSSVSSVTCGDEILDLDESDLTGVDPDNSGVLADYHQKEFFWVFQISGRNVCAGVKVLKKTNDLTNGGKTVIISDGYNLSSLDPGVAGDCTPSNINRAVQRTIQTVTAG